MAEGRRVFTDAKQSSQSGCKKLGKHGSRQGAVRPDLLKTIQLPQGGSYELSYELKKGTPFMPQSKYVLSQTDKTDGLEKEAGIHRYRQRFRYEDGYYDRELKDFYGYETVITEAVGLDGTVYGTTVTRYYNDAYYRKGMVRSTRQEGTDGESAQRVVYRQTYMETEDAPYAQIKERTETLKEANGASSTRTV